MKLIRLSTMAKVFKYELRKLETIILELEEKYKCKLLYKQNKDHVPMFIDIVQLQAINPEFLGGLTQIEWIQESNLRGKPHKNQTKIREEKMRRRNLRNKENKEINQIQIQSEEIQEEIPSDITDNMTDLQKKYSYFEVCDLIEDLERNNNEKFTKLENMILDINATLAMANILIKKRRTEPEE